MDSKSLISQQGAEGFDLAGVNPHKYETLVELIVNNDPNAYVEGDMAARRLARTLLLSYHMAPKPVKSV